jgi:hypothetical protein
MIDEFPRRRHRRSAAVAALGTAVCLVTALNMPLGGAAETTRQPGAAELPDAPVSSHFATASIEEHQTAPTDSDGDLWPSCWADDGHLYTANGDGKGFSLDQPFADIAVNQVRGMPGNLSGETIARGDEVGSIWSGAGYNRKPTAWSASTGRSTSPYRIWRWTSTTYRRPRS